jgi:hypothetical protein
MPGPAPGWTVSEAVAKYAETGLPMDGLDQIIRALPGFTRIGETRSGKKGGRGQALYEIKELQLLHGALARWLTPPPG